jgi:hypothetical protein
VIPMKAIIDKISGNRRQMRRKSVGQILRASYERFAKNEEAMMAVKLVLGSGIESSTMKRKNVLSLL